MTPTIINLDSSMYSGFIAQLLNIFGDYHVLMGNFTEESSTGEIIGQALSMLDIPWIMGVFTTIVTIYCCFRLLSTIISRI